MRAQLLQEDDGPQWPPTLAIKAAKVGVFGGITRLEAVPGSSIAVNPTDEHTPGADALRQWCARGCVASAKAGRFFAAMHSLPAMRCGCIWTFSEVLSRRWRRLAGAGRTLQWCSQIGSSRRTAAGRRRRRRAGARLLGYSMRLFSRL